MKYGIAEDYVGDCAGERHVFNGAGLEVFGGQAGLERFRKLTDVIDGLWVLVEREDPAAGAQQVDEVAAIAASGVEDVMPGSMLPRRI